MKFNEKYCYKYKDIFNIHNRIKKINSNYQLYFNAKDKQFIVVNIAKNNQICLNFTTLHQNIEKLLLSTRVENFNRIIKSIDDHNLNLESKCKDNLIYKTKTNLSSMTNLLSKTPYL